MTEKKETPFLSRPITILKGVGEARATALARMGIFTLSDLIKLYPRAYQNRGDTKTVAEIKSDMLEQLSGVSEDDQKKASVPYSVILTVASEPTVKMIRRGMTIMKFRAFDETGAVAITYFNQQYLKNTMHTGTVFRFFGRVTYDYGALQMQNPIAEPYYEGAPLADIVPIYPLSQGLTQKSVAGLVSEALRLSAAELSEFIPKHALAEMSLPTYSHALAQIHRPESISAIESAKRRFVFEELYLMLLAIELKGRSARRKNHIKMTDCDLSEFISALPYELTSAQSRCIAEILADMSGEDLMNRILTGDVGSGKTIVAAAGAYIAVKNGFRAAIMVPTEILAEQHAEDLNKLFSPMGINVALLTGSTKKKARELIIEGMTNNNPMNRVDIVVGTQALISEEITIEDLGLAVIDEQHRFGVMQRAALFEKAENVHCLVMSATPIPRTMTLAVYGSIDVSRIDELPKGRQKIDTFIINESYRERLNAFIQKQADEGRQTYVVCPAVEEKKDSDDPEEAESLSLIDALFADEPTLPLRAAEAEAEYLTEALPNLNIGLIHGKMKTSERERVMKAYEKGEINVLVSTTVIEVGVNVPNATLMIVKNAERFGLSQLHQLRGRVGRGVHKSYFILVSDSKNPNAQERLKAIKSTNDGFRIAEYDLELRGPGDFFNESGVIRQSGQMNFTLASSCTDSHIMEKASAYAKKTLEDDPQLESPENKVLTFRLSDFSKKTEKTSN